jgi:flavin reductase
MNVEARTDGQDDVAQSFKNAMRRLASTVTIITTAEDHAWHGMAATAVCSVGIAPPSVQVCIGRQTSIHDPLLRSGRFCVNILGVNHMDLVEIFSGKIKGQARFAHGYWRLDNLEIPCLTDARACIFCRVADTLEFSGHSIIVGEVLKAQVSDGVHALIHDNGRAVTTRQLSIETN